MEETFPKIFPLLISDEGTKYTDDPDDLGGATKFGITLDRLRLWRKDKSLPKSEVKNLTLDEAEKIYVAHYWDFMKCDILPAGLDYTVFDFGVNSGPTRSIKFLQKVVGTDVDGQIGPDTIKKVVNFVDSHGIDNVIKKFNDARRDFLKGLNQKKWIRGWLLRVDRVEKKSLELANGE